MSQSLPYHSAASQSLVMVHMQINAKFEKEQVGTLLVFLGALKRGGRRWVVGQGVQPKNKACLRHCSDLIASPIIRKICK